MFLIDKLRLYRLSFEKRVDRYFEVLEGLDVIKSSINELVSDYNTFKQGIDNEISLLEKGEKDFFLKQKLQEKYNAYFSDYLTKVGDLKKGFDFLVYEKQLLLKNNLLKGVVANFEKAELLGQTRDFVYKKYLTDCLKLKRRELPQLDSGNLQEILPQLKEFNIVVQEIEVPLSQLKPTQGEFNEEKILDMIADFNRPEFVYITSQDGYIVDGHHTWASELEKNENSVGDVIMIGLSIQDLLDFLNKLEIFKKLDLQDEEIQKSIAVLVESYRLGKISSIEFDRVSSYLQKGIYKDNEDNRRQVRVGLHYGGKKKKESLSYKVIGGRVKMENGENLLFSDFLKDYKGQIEYIVYKHKHSDRTYLRTSRGDFYTGMKTDQKKKISPIPLEYLVPIRVQFDKDLYEFHKQNQENQAKQSLDKQVQEEEQQQKQSEIDNEYKD